MKNEDLGLISTQSWCDICQGQRRQVVGEAKWVMHSPTECLVHTIRSHSTDHSTDLSSIQMSLNMIQQSLQSMQGSLAQVVQELVVMNNSRQIHAVVDRRENIADHPGIVKPK